MVEFISMKPLVPVWKPLGWTPLKTIEEFKKENFEYENEKISYAGRLDPMAEGILLLLVGEENKNRKRYESLSKKYNAEIVLGITTDSFDALGIINSIKPSSIFLKNRLKEVLKKFEGKKNQKYPPFSSKPVKGKPLYFWAKKGRISEVEIPEKQIEINSLEIEEIENISTSNLYKDAVGKISKTEGDFRQKEILKSWKEFVKKSKTKKFQSIKIEISCSSGTYIRRLASDIGEELSCGAFALSIIRTKVGKYSRKDCVFGI